ncbi:MAG TPA: GTPase [Candidatus Nanoarchaeia archaeon]|nr:GTPase [Candidatus Nanoarchaeia archaeon]
MRPRYSFSSRRTGHIENMRKQRKKFPSIAEQILNESDIIIEVLDARFISDTKNPEIEAFIKARDKKIIYAINKADLIDEKNIEVILEKSVLVSCKTRNGINQLRNIIKIISSQLKKDKVVVGVLGYPNTGKSSLINSLIGKKSAPSSSQAGYTKALQKLKLMDGIVLLDSPGVIPKNEYSGVESKKIAQHAKVGARTYSNVRDPEQIITEIMREFPGLLEEHYNILTNGDSETLIEKLGEKKSFYKKGSEIDADKVSRFILKEWQEGKIKIR